jgi:hypothetical protein
VKKTKGGWLKMAEKVENVVNAGLGKSENVNAVERRAENQNVREKNAKSLAKLVMEKIQSLDIDLNEISELNENIREITTLNIEIQKLSERRLQLLNRTKEIYEKLGNETKAIMEILGLLKVDEVERIIYGKTSTERTSTRASKGNGLTGKKINFKGQVYNIATYFCNKHGIKGGIEGLREWATKNGYKVIVNENEIIIS